MNSRNILIGALAGLAIGTLVGALYSNSTTEEFASQAGKKGKAYSKGLKKVFNKFLGEVKSKARSAQDEGSELIKKGRNESARVKDKLESALN